MYTSYLDKLLMAAVCKHNLPTIQTLLIYILLREVVLTKGTTQSRCNKMLMYEFPAQNACDTQLDGSLQPAQFHT